METKIIFSDEPFDVNPKRSMMQIGGSVNRWLFRYYKFMPRSFATIIIGTKNEMDWFDQSYDGAKVYLLNSEMIRAINDCDPVDIVMSRAAYYQVFKELFDMPTVPHVLVD